MISPTELSHSQLEIISLFASGLTRAEIGKKRHINPATVTLSLKRSRDNLGYTNDGQLCAEALASGAIERVRFGEYQVTES